MKPRLIPCFVLAFWIALLSPLANRDASTRVLAAPAGSSIYWGAIIRGSHYGLPEPPWDMRAVDVFESHTGKKVSIIHFGLPWYSSGTPQKFPQQLFDNVRNHGSIPLFSWSSRDSAGDKTNQPNFRSAVVASGVYDSYITQFATDVKNWGHPFFLRFDWEMNGWWYPWAEGSLGTTGVIVNGNQPGDYVAMWKHVHDIFAQVGATNVTWVWCINQMSNTTSGKHPPMAQVYPGDAYVDWTGFDNYNRYSGWESFNTMLTGAGTTWLLNTYQSTLDIAPTKPMMLAEWGSKEDKTDATRKANWLTDALATQLPNNFPNIKAIVYFNWNTTSDPNNPDSSIAIESSAQAQSAFAAGIASSYYAANTFADLPPGPIAPIAQTVTSNLLKNPSFEATGTAWLAPWTLSVKSGASASASQDSTAMDGTHSAKINTTQTSGKWSVGLAQGNLALQANTGYTITLWAKASAAHATTIIVQQNYSPWTEYTKQPISLGTGWKQYVLTFTSPVSDGNLKLSISAGDVVGALWLDGVSIVRR